MNNSRVIIAILDDYQKLVPELEAFSRLKQHLPGADIRIIDSMPLGAAQIHLLADVQYLVLIRERSRITAGLLDKLPSLKAIVQTGTAGAPETSHIDQAACAALGIPIIEGGGSDGHSAAEITWALILNARRRVPEYMASMARGQWHKTNPPVGIGQSVQGQTLGILGYGRIGRLLAQYGQAFGMRILVWGREQTRTAARETGVELAESREALFRRSDVLTLHMRMNETSRHSVRRSDLALMKPTALLVNTSRPGLIEPGALREALAMGRPGAAALDVHDDEPVLASNGPYDGLNVTATPHIGFVEKSSYEVLFGAAFERFLMFLEQGAQAGPQG
ncbi:D-2-hydroxyacid dehydrogenase family protein [Pollutimonas sp. H1-120]|uniref:D-2-hydroxyacid dehydrogenase family protein n=1 Tax=Pollutimonas sp. H1-120 TaxID=3148824 RepID=UPI003B51EB70